MLLGGIEPGVIPPISAWWPRAAVKNRASSPRKHRHDHGDVGQMRAAGIRRVEDIDIAGLDAAPIAPIAARGDDGF